VIGGALRLWANRRSGVGAWPAPRTVIGSIGLAAIPVVVLAAALAVVAIMNQRHYGAFTINDFQSGPYLRAYGALSRIQHEQWIRQVPVPDDALKKAYAVSAAARELQPSFEGKLGGAWRRMGCENARRNPCPGFLGGWFMWLLREAVAAAGYYSSERDAFAFYDRLAAEIDAACDTGRIACIAPRATMAPPFRWQYTGDALSVTPELGRILLSFGDGHVGAPPSIGDEFTLGLFSDLVGPLSRPPVSTVVLLGTVIERESAVRLSVRDREGSPSRTDLRFMPPADPDLAAIAGAKDFELTTDCVRPSCELVVSDGANERIFPIADVGVGPLAASDGMNVAVRHTFGRGRSSKFPIASEMRRDLLLGIARGIAKFYAAAMPVLTPIAVLGVLVAFAMSRRAPWPGGLMTLALACATAVSVRILQSIRSTCRRRRRSC
jgi:hypothetical protein